MEICLNKNCIKPIIILIFIGVIILSFYVIAYVNQNVKKINDPLNKILYELPGSQATIWQLSHFIVYFILGFFFPFCDLPVILIGIIWELIEHIFGFLLPPIKVISKNGNISNVQWWHGSVYDIFVNILGFYLGKYFRLKQNSKKYF